MDETRRRPCCRGFTLFELLLVLAILATTAVVVVPRLGPSPKSEIDAAVRILGAGLRQARSQAVTTGKEVVFVVDLNRKRFDLLGDPGGGLRGEPQGGPPPRSVGKRLPASVSYRLLTAEQERLSATVAGVRFYPDGTSTGGRVTAVAGKLERFVDIDWLTGKIRARQTEAG